jgi:Tfp pilus assembly protein PilN
VRAINLLPKDSDSRRGQPQKTQWLVLVPVVLAVLLTAVLSAMFLSASGTAKDKQAELATLQDELRAIPTPDAAKVKTQSALAADKQARVTAVSAALSRRVAWDRVFRELSLVLPDDVWLATISAKAPVPSSSAIAPPAAAPGSALAATGFTIDGFTYSHAAVARLLSRLAVIPDLVNVQLQQSTRTKLANANAVHFTIAADVRRPGGGQ